MTAATRRLVNPFLGFFMSAYDILIAADAVLRFIWAFEKAKRACLPELYQGQTSFLPTAWGYDHAEETNRMMFPAGDPWPYGIENNRKTLEPFLAFCHEQGVTRRKLAVEELFPKEVSFALISCSTTLATMARTAEVPKISLVCSATLWPTVASAVSPAR